MPEPSGAHVTTPDPVANANGASSRGGAPPPAGTMAANDVVFSVFPAGTY